MMRRDGDISCCQIVNFVHVYKAKLYNIVKDMGEALYFSTCNQLQVQRNHIQC